MQLCLNRLLALSSLGWGFLLSVCAEVPQPVEALPIIMMEQVGIPVFESGYTDLAVLDSEQPIIHSGSTTFYDHGQPTAYEQLLLELLNRARADPGAEATRRSIDLNQGLSPGTISNTPKQPLAMHRFLVDAARDHSQWMLDTDTFSHTGEGGSTIGQRIVAAGYALTGSWTWGENISWGGASGSFDSTQFTLARHTNLFRSSGHRVNMMNDDFEEVGMGVKEGIFDGWNALMATQKFGRSGATPSPFLVGAAYYDFDGDGIYSVGEAIGGVTVTIDAGTHYTETAQAGGYTLPMPSSAGTRTVVFSGTGFSYSTNISFPDSRNVKVDFVPAYMPPSLSGTLTPTVGIENSYTLSSVIGATEYEVVLQSRSPAPMDSPSNLSRMIDGSSPSYSAYQTAVRRSAPGAYQLAHTAIGTEWLEYTTTFVVQSEAILRFRSRLRAATADQVARVQVAADGSPVWNTVYSQAGSGWPGEGSFSLKELDLSAYEGQEVRLRFAYVFASGSFFNQTGADFGWFIDDIEFVNIRAIETLDTVTLDPGDSILFEPAAEGDFWLQARPWNFETPWPMGPALMVTAVEGAADDYGSWAAERETAYSLPPGTLTDPAGDYSGDGVKHLMAYVLNLDPTVGIPSAQLPHFLPGQPVFAFWQATGISDAYLIPQVSVDFVNWYDWNNPASPVAATYTLGAVDGAIQHRQLSFAGDTNAAVAVRLRAWQ